MYKEIKKELSDLIKDKGIISWSNNVLVEEIFEKYDLYDDQNKFLNVTTNLCMDLTEEFYAHHIDDDIIFTTKPIKHYIRLRKLFSATNKAELKLLLAVYGVEDLREEQVDNIFNLIKSKDGLVKQSVFVVYEGCDE